MIYPYKCRACGDLFDVTKSMREGGGPEPCPECDALCEQDYSRKVVHSFVSTEGDWTGGKQIMQLPPHHPDYRVSNRRDMERAYKRNGLCMDTGKFVSREAQAKATLPPKEAEKVINNPDIKVGGLREEG